MGYLGPGSPGSSNLPDPWGNERQWVPPGSQGPAARPPSPPRRPLDRRTVVWIIAGIVIVIALTRLNHVNPAELLLFLVIIPSIILHEVTHGFVALMFGDDTAKRAGRLTLNPIPHIDPFGTIILPALLVMSGLPAFGWAKPVPVNISRLRHPRNDEVIVALAGPAVNIGLATILGLLYGLTVPGVVKVEPLSLQPLIDQLLLLAGYVNVLLAVFNLLPIPPLDGSAVIERILPRSWLYGYMRIRPFALVLVLFVVLVFPAALDRVFNPALNLWSHLLG